MATIRSFFTAVVSGALCAAIVAGAAPSWACTGDCSVDGTVTVDELIEGVNILLGRSQVADCPPVDRNGDGTVTVDELVDAVRAALDGCAATSPTSTPTAMPTVTATGGASCETAGVICTMAGTGEARFDGDGGPALQASLYFPLDLDFDRDGHLLILDYNNNHLRRVEADGTITSIMGLSDGGVPVEGTPVDGTLAIDTPLHHTSDMAFDQDFRLYLAGDHVSVVFRVGTDDRVFGVAGRKDEDGNYVYGYSGDDGPALQAELGVPFGVLPDRSGGFYISDADVHVVRYVDAMGIITRVAGTGATDLQGNYVSGYGGDGGPATEAQLGGPSHLALGPDGAVYFCEIKNHVIRRLLPDGTIDTFAGTGERGYSGNQGPAKQARFDTPRDLHFDPSGNLYVADTNNNVIRRIDVNGIVTTVVGTGAPDFTGDGGAAADCTLKRPSGVVFDAGGSMWIADTSNQRVRRVWHFLETSAVR